MKKSLFVILIFLIGTLCSCSRVKTSDLTTQDRYYTEEERTEVEIDIDQEDQEGTSEQDETSSPKEAVKNQEEVELPEYDFTSNEISGDIYDKLLDLCLEPVLTDKLSDNEGSNEICFSTEIDDNSYIVQINGLSVKTYDELNDYFKSLEYLDEILDWSKDNEMLIEKYLVLDVSIKNASEKEISFNPGNYQLYSKVCSKGDYSFLAYICNFVGMDYTGDNRGTDKDYWKLNLKKDETISTNFLFYIYEYDGKYLFDVDKLYYATSLRETPGLINSDGIWEPNTSERFKLSKINVSER